MSFRKGITRANTEYISQKEWYWTTGGIGRTNHPGFARADEYNQHSCGALEEIVLIERSRRVDRMLYLDHMGVPVSMFHNCWTHVNGFGFVCSIRQPRWLRVNGLRTQQWLRTHSAVFLGASSRIGASLLRGRAIKARDSSTSNVCPITPATIYSSKNTRHGYIAY